MEKIDESKIINCDPDKLFLEIFTNYPQNAHTYKIISNDVKLEETFEILIDLYGESLMNMNILLFFLGKTTDPHQPFIIDYYDIKEEDLLIPEIWFKSVGYSLLITRISEEIINELNPYCSIIFKDNPLDIGYFYMRNIPNKYHFIKKQNYKNKNELKQIKAILTVPTKKYNTEYYSISFTPL